jgi:entericidin B
MNARIRLYRDLQLSYQKPRAGTPLANSVWALNPKNHFKEIYMFRTLLAVALMAVFATGCNTMAGAGKDIERGGEKVQGAAERNK